MKLTFSFNFSNAHNKNRFQINSLRFILFVYFSSESRSKRRRDRESKDTHIHTHIRPNFNLLSTFALLRVIFFLHTIFQLLAASYETYLYNFFLLSYFGKEFLKDHVDCFSFISIWDLFLVNVLTKRLLLKTARK